MHGYVIATRISKAAQKLEMAYMTWGQYGYQSGATGEQEARSAETELRTALAAWR